MINDPVTFECPADALDDPMQMCFDPSLSVFADASLSAPEGAISGGVNSGKPNYRFWRVRFAGSVLFLPHRLSELKFDDSIDIAEATYTDEPQQTTPGYVVTNLQQPSFELEWWSQTAPTYTAASAFITFPFGVLPTKLQIRAGLTGLSVSRMGHGDTITLSAKANEDDDWIEVLSFTDSEEWTDFQLREYDLAPDVRAAVNAPEGQIAASVSVTAYARAAATGPEGAISVLALYPVRAYAALSGPEGVLRASLFNDFSGILPIEARIYYACELVAEGLPPLRVAISSWQATSQIEQASFAQIVIPGVLDLISDIQDYAAADGEFIVYRGAQLPNSDAKAESPLIRSPMQTLRFQRGPTNATLTVSGYTVLPTPDVVTTRILQNIRSQTLEPRQRIRCDIDWFLAPGFTATALGDSFIVGWINFYANAQESYMDVGELAPE